MPEWVPPPPRKDNDGGADGSCRARPEKLSIPGATSVKRTISGSIGCLVGHIHVQWIPAPCYNPIYFHIYLPSPAFSLSRAKGEQRRFRWRRRGLKPFLYRFNVTSHVAVVEASRQCPGLICLNLGPRFPVITETEPTSYSLDFHPAEAKVTRATDGELWPHLSLWAIYCTHSVTCLNLHSSSRITPGRADHFLIIFSLVKYVKLSLSSVRLLNKDQ